MDDIPIKQNEKLKCVSVESYTKALPRGAKRAFAKTIPKNTHVALPDYTDLQIGDIILTRGNMKKPHAKKIWYKQIEANHSEENSEFTHAMLYVGKLHVAESVFAWFKLNPLKFFQSGVRVVPLSTAIANSDVKIMRASRGKDSDDEGVAELRFQAGHYALLDHAINRRVYNLSRVAEINSTNNFVRRIWAEISKKREGEQSVICSHYVMECISVGMGINPKGYIEMTHGRQAVYPAQFITMNGLSEVKLDIVLVGHDF